MGLKEWLFYRGPVPAPPREPPPPLPETTAEVMRVVAQAPLFNPSDEDHLKGAHYRADAIAREIEQREAEDRDRHTEHDQMVGEAMSHAWKLYSAGKWTREHVDALERRLLGR